MNALVNLGPWGGWQNNPEAGGLSTCDYDPPQRAEVVTLTPRGHKTRDKVRLWNREHDGSSGGESHNLSHISHIPKGMKKEKKTNTPAFKQLRVGNDEVSDTVEGSRGFIHMARKQMNSLAKVLTVSARRVRWTARPSKCPTAK